ncbi:MAG: hypothetical protein EDM03_12350 [Porphyrobacter sp. IPPAS B-1204]|nr:MAG: hypothetical protein EDM03_12350 [Porphyrobacter sp. IPPAS B-1204]
MSLRALVLGAGLVLAMAPPVAAQSGDFVTLPNGQRVRATAPDGGRGKVNPDGSISYPDGTRVGVGAGDSTVVTRPDGSTRSSPPPDTFELPNGQQVRATDPSGQRGKQNADGSVTYPDGTTVGMDNKGETVITRPDGSLSGRDAPDKGPAGGGTDSAGTGWATLPNGERVPATGPDGQPGVLDSAGNMTYGDGTVISGAPGTATTVTGSDGVTRDYRNVREALDEAMAKAPLIDVEQARAISDRMTERGLKMAELARERRNCAKGDAGDQCRKTISDAIRQLERENKDDAAAYLEAVQAGRGQPR